MTVANLAVNITGRGRGLINEFHKVGNAAEKAGRKSSGGWKKAGKGIGLAAAGIVGAIGAIGFASADAAIEDQKSQKLLRTSLKSTTGATDTQVAGVEKWITKMQNASGIMDDDLRPALSQLLRATGDQTKAQDLLQVAMDVSTATGKPLQAVTIAISKASLGQVGALGRLGIQTKNAAGETLTFEQALEKMKQKMGGATAAAADTLSGKMAIAKAKFEDAKEQIGQAFIPVLAKLADFLVDTVIPGIKSTYEWFQEKWGPAIKRVAGMLREKLLVAVGEVKDFITSKLIPAVQNIISWFKDHDDVARALAISVGTVLVGAMLAYVGAATYAAVATVVATWPVWVLIGVIAGVVLVLDKLGVKWDRVWRGAKRNYDMLEIPKAIRNTKSAIEDVQRTAESLKWAWGPIWKGMKSVAVDIIDYISDAVRRLTSAIESMVDLFGRIGSAVGIGDDSLDRLVRRTEARRPGGLAGVTGVPGQSSSGGGIVRRRAAGGPVSPFSSYLVGERGPEMLTMGAGGGTVHPNAGSTVVINVSGILVGGKSELERMLTDALVSYERKNGRRYAAVVNP